MTIDLAGEKVTLDADRALVWNDAVILADLHFGKDASARALSIAVPAGTTAADLARLDRLLTRHSARELWLLGDVFDSAHARDPGTLDPMIAWRHRHPELTIKMVVGNHDRRALGLAEQAGFQLLPDLAPIGPWRLSHHPGKSADGYVLCGHIHPGLRMRGPARESLRLPAFIMGKTQAILPAFGAMTGLAISTLGRDDHGYVVAGDRIVGPIRSTRRNA